MILQLLYLRQLWFYNCQTWADYNFTIVIHALITFYIFQNIANYDFTIFLLVPTMVLKLLYLHQLWFYNCQIGANYIFYNCHTWTSYDFKLSDLCQLFFYNYNTCANYNFTIVVLSPIMILQLSYLRQLWF